MLIAAFNQGRDGALARFGVKTAAVPLARPHAFKAPAPAAAGPAARPGGLTPAEEAHAQRLMKMTPAQRQQDYGFDRNSQNDRYMQEHGIAPNPAALQTAGAAGGARRPWGKFKKTLALGGLGTAGAIGLGLHQDLMEDRAKHPLVYSPMQGSMMG